MSTERHYFPGNNTPQGFFSYYKYILGQREANRIICIKGGPGTGKSTFMKRIGERFAKLGEDIDYLHCSADEDSLDGVILKNRRIALIDGTSPHITDPVTPGAVDKIINLGEFWNEEGIALNKDEIIDLNEDCSGWYRIAYNYLNAAKSVFKSLEEIYYKAVEDSEIYRVVADIVTSEYGEYPICLRPGRQKKFFAGAITPGGLVNYLRSLLDNIQKVYLVSVPEGFSNQSFMEVLKEGAVYRGFDTEVFYCPMGPDEKIDHIIVPQLSLAFITVNEYHDLEPWELFDEEEDSEEREKELTLIDISDYMKQHVLEENTLLMAELKEEYEILLGRAIKALECARKAHMKVESMYIPNMNFTRISALSDEVFEELSKI
ncbi:MAG: hypothetical protein ACI4LL_06935 [Anaerovoracaceae bacterium]|nr:ATPase [Bacillota bacterium]MDY5770341.1 hypothetical protein [Anaerovoracaceae bacterium]